MSGHRRPWRLVVEQSDEVIDLHAWAKRYVEFLVRHQSDAPDGDSHPAPPHPSFRTTAGAVTLA